MQSRKIILGSLVLLAALCHVTGCSKGNQSSDPMAFRNSDTSVTTRKIINGQSVTQTETKRTTTEPLPGNGQFPVDANSNYRTDNFDDNDSNRQVRLSAPFVNLHVDRDTGSVHLNTPLVRIDKNGRGQGTQIEIPRTQNESN